MNEWEKKKNRGNEMTLGKEEWIIIGKARERPNICV